MQQASSRGSAKGKLLAQGPPSTLDLRSSTRIVIPTCAKPGQPVPAFKNAKNPTTHLEQPTAKLGKPLLPPNYELRTTDHGLCTLTKLKIFPTVSVLNFESNY